MRILSIIAGLVFGLSTVSFCYAMGSVDNDGWLEGRGLAVRPVAEMASKLPDRAWFLYGIGLGETIEDGIEFWNKRQEAVDVVVEAVDAELLDGAFALKGPEFVGDGHIGRWVNVRDNGRVTTVAAGQKKIFRFSVNVPRDVSKGDYWGGVTVREVAQRESVSQKGAALWRVGVRMLLRVRSGGATQYLPQTGGRVVYYPELTLFLGRIFRFLPAPFGRG